MSGFNWSSLIAPAASAVTGALLTKLLAPKPQQLQIPQQGATPQIPEAPESPIPMPTPASPQSDTPAVQAAQRRSIAQQLNRRGRASTILTDSNYSSDTLG